MRNGLVGLLLACTLLVGCGTGGGDPTPASRGTSGDPPATSSPETVARDPQTDVPALINERCTRCHDTQRIKRARHDQITWERTVARMRGRGARLSDFEARQVVEFLAGGGGAQL